MTEAENKKRNWADFENDSDSEEEEQEQQNSQQELQQPQVQEQPASSIKKTEDNNTQNSSSKYNNNNNNNRRNNNRGGNRDRYNNDRPPRENNNRNEFQPTPEELRRDIESIEGDSITLKIGKTSQQLSEELIQTTFPDVTLIEAQADKFGNYYKVKISRDDALEIVNGSIKDYPFTVRIWFNTVPSGAGQKKKYNEKTTSGKTHHGDHHHNKGHHHNNKDSESQQKATSSANLIEPENCDNEGFSYVMNNKRGTVEDHEPGNYKGNKFNNNNNNNSHNRRHHDNHNNNRNQQQDDGIVFSRNPNNKPVFSNSQREGQTKGNTSTPAATISRNESHKQQASTPNPPTAQSGAPKMTNSKKDAALHLTQKSTSIEHKAEDLTNQRGIGDQDSGNDENPGSSAVVIEELQSEKQHSVDLFETPNQSLKEVNEPNPNSTTDVKPANTKGNNRDYKKKNNNNTVYERKNQQEGGAKNEGQPAKSGYNNAGKQQSSQSQGQSNKGGNPDQKKRTGGPYKQQSQQQQAPEIQQAQSNKKTQKPVVNSKNVFGMLSDATDEEDD